MSKEHIDLSARTDRPGIDDLKLIVGIGPGVERRFHNANIFTFGQLAALSPRDIANMLTELAGLSAERIAKQDWIGQARDLAARPATSNTEQTELERRQRYATFTVELLLDEDNDVRRTRVVHIQAEDEESWAGWESARLIDFIVQRGDMRMVTFAQEFPSAQTVEPKPMAIPMELPALVAAKAPTDTVGKPAGLSGASRLRQLELMPDGADSAHGLLRHDQPFSARLLLDLTAVAAPAETALSYYAVIHTRKMGGGVRTIVGEAQGTLAMADLAVVMVPNLTLAPGTYRPEAVIVLTPADAAHSGIGLTAMLEGGLLQVY
ncbi:MAG: hypothetical protein ABI901_04605 [Roseiflexaceae bacterium]